MPTPSICGGVQIGVPQNFSLPTLASLYCLGKEEFQGIIELIIEAAAAEAGG